MAPGEEIGIRVDQVLLNDASGPLVALELEARSRWTTRRRAARSPTRHELSPRQIDMLLDGGAINWMKARLAP